MRILEWGGKNYKSFGSNGFNIKLNQEKGELILLNGKNGAGKSTILTCLELATYGEEMNKRGTKLPKSNFPNRTNGDMHVYVKYQTDEKLEIDRYMANVSAPLKTKLKIETIEYDKANKVDGKILEKLGIDYKTYKSFISMNVNNFKNFISMTPEEKRLLLDKLFNLDQINELNKILKQLKSTNDTTFTTINKEIDIYKQNIIELQNTINSINEKKKINTDEKSKSLKLSLEEKKKIYLELEESKEVIKNQKKVIDTSKIDIQQDINDFIDGINSLKIKKTQIDRDISDIKEKINLYKSGKCPTCLTILIGELDLTDEYQERLEKTILIKDKTEKKINDANIELIKYQTDFDDLNKSLMLLNTELDDVDSDLTELLTEVTTIKTELKSLKTTENDNFDQFDENINNIKDKISEKECVYLESQKLKFVYDILLPMWGENGIKRDIIDSIIDPINQFINEDLKYLKTTFKVNLDNNFDAHVLEFNNEIDPETLSSGEAKKINLIIMLAYIKMLRLKRDINVLFLDEVFTTIDVTSINDMLELFKAFANERNINVFLVHHSELNDYHFDKIISVKKNTFTYLETKIIN